MLSAFVALVVGVIVLLGLVAGKAGNRIRAGGHNRLPGAGKRRLHLEGLFVLTGLIALCLEIWTIEQRLSPPGTR